MGEERALAIARAFDAYPYLRPVRVGGDPARIKVEPSMEALVRAHELPIRWLTVRRNEGSGLFEGGEINLSPGRGAWMASYLEDGGMDFMLGGHEIEQTWVAETLAPHDGAVAEVEALFERLVVAADAAWGCVLPWAWWPFPLNTTIEAALPGVFWLNYFGPAFVAAHPALTKATGARMLETGGVLVRTTDEPWQPKEEDTPAWQVEIREIFGPKAFKWKRPNPALPTIEEHMAASPGTMEMPWVPWLAQKSIDDRAKKHRAALGRLAKASEARTEPSLPEDTTEWSTSFDLEDWQEFAKYLTRKLRGDLTTALGKAALSVITTAPLDDEGSIRLSTQHGVVELGWFIGDHDTVDIAIWGTADVYNLCAEWFQ